MSEEIETSTIDELPDSNDEVIEESAEIEGTVEPVEPTEQDKIQKRIDKAVYEKHQARREAQEAKRELEDFRSRSETPQNGDPQDTEKLYDFVKQEAQRLRAEETFNDACNKVYEAGTKEFGANFDKAMQNLSLVGVSRDFLELVSTSDNGGKVLNYLGQDIDEAERIASLPPLQMARELTKLDIKLGQQKTKPVSKAPAPITPVSAKSGGSKSPADMTDKEYAEWRRSASR